MKKSLLAFLLGTSLWLSTAQQLVFAQTGPTDTTVTTDVNPAQPKVPYPLLEQEDTAADKGFHQVLKEQFIAGDWRYMLIVLLCLIFGLTISFERIIILNLATVNTDKLLVKLEKALEKEGVDGAKKLCRNTKGPVASIFTQGLLRNTEDIATVEKSIAAYGSVEMSKLERGMVWVSLFISLAPMLGFMGTVVGMISAFDAIAAAGDISPSLVADGIKIALLTTVGGLIVAIILQLFYNYLVAKIDTLVNSMEEASIAFVDILLDYNKKQPAKG